MNTATAILPTDISGGPGSGERLRGKPAEGQQGAFSAMLQGGALAQAILARISVDTGPITPLRDAPEPTELTEPTEPTEPMAPPKPVDTMDTDPVEPTATPEPKPADKYDATEHPEAERAEAERAEAERVEAERADDIPHAPDAPFAAPTELDIPFAAPAETPVAATTPVETPEPAVEVAAATPQPAATGQSKPEPHTEPGTTRPSAPMERLETALNPTRDAPPHLTTPRPTAPHPTGPRLTAQVTERPAELLSQPATTLSASATVAAQTSTDKRNTLRAAAVGDPMADTGPRTPDAMARHAHAGGQTSNGRNQPGNPFAQTAQTAPATPSPVAGAAGTAFALLTPQTATAGNAAAAAGLQTAVSATGSDAGSAGAPGGPQAIYRAAGQARFQRGRPPVPPQALTRQVAVQIQKAAGQGIDRIQIQLKPADLGRVEIRLEVPPDGRATILISADRQDTLDLLQRDSRSLQASLQDAGLQTDGDSLKFSLRGDGNTADNRTESKDQAEELADSEALPGTEAGRPQILLDDQIDITV